MVVNRLRSAGVNLKDAKLVDLALMAEIIAAIAIVASLFFVGMQISENSRSTRAESAIASIEAMSDWYAGLGLSEQTSTNFLNGMTDPDTLSREEWFQFVMHFHSAMLNFQNSFYLAEEGTLDTEIRDSLTAAISAVKDTPGFHRFWAQRKAIFFPEFQAFIDEIVASNDKNSEGLYLPRDRELLEAE